jgi:hypothetical protein
MPFHRARQNVRVSAQVSLSGWRRGRYGGGTFMAWSFPRCSGLSGRHWSHTPAGVVPAAARNGWTSIRVGLAVFSEHTSLLSCAHGPGHLRGWLSNFETPPHALSPSLSVAEARLGERRLEQFDRITGGVIDHTCLPPTPATSSLRRWTPASRSLSTMPARSEISIENRFQPPGSGKVPSGIA